MWLVIMRGLEVHLKVKLLRFKIFQMTVFFAGLLLEIRFLLFFSVSAAWECIGVSTKYCPTTMVNTLHYCLRNNSLLLFTCFILPTGCHSLLLPFFLLINRVGRRSARTRLWPLIVLLFNPTRSRQSGNRGA